MELKATLFEAKGPVAMVTLCRPHRHNAWTGRMHTELRYLLEKAETNPEIRTVVITGKGKDFCVGADSQALEGHIEKGGYDSGTDAELANPGYGVAPQFDHNFAFMFGLNVTTIAAVNGAAAGVGLVLACYCDLRFAANNAKLTTAHGPLGLPAEFGLSWLLPRLIGLTRANDLLLSSRVLLASETDGWGLFNDLLEPEDLLPQVHAYARNLATRVAPSAQRMTKRQIYLDQHQDVGSAISHSEELLETAMTDPDYREGVKALIEGRAPRWGEDD
ncbi:MAG: enoyl-CoA hydratase-related protein [Actinomycetota bacterium]|nr:enoyl-CoA hydratase [Acidimicrobiaceae bacterium]MCS5673501.1 enoyl-CoA hydratase-related protein [Acidimicrobiales bacterium]MED5541922.1 enoyl-CoA hydratase-related protein [Actinomycetota bacterium]MEE2807649.1 enoyl-CoA hydratase-related protein [Actinomycetota bacterium]|tara:strand:+ start:3163 stop:3987 length:825 start_codon:yes stop_codon:yes gene_type:complete